MQEESTEKKKEGISHFLLPLELSRRFPKAPIVSVVVVVIILILFSLTPPSNFPVGEKITVESGASLGQVSLLLKEGQFIHSRLMFEFCMITVSGDRNVVAGDYVFKQPLSACGVASRTARGISGMPATRVTIPEGMSNARAADIFAKALPKFDARSFIENAQALEGYLFPETYFFPPAANAEDVVKVMVAQFKKKIEPLKPSIEKSGHSLEEIIIMASILEKEAKTPEDQALVSGILWKRIKIGMALQVDAPFYYLLGKESSELTQSDLALKSEYNTYKNKGLPAGPIGNPGLVAIQAAISPTLSPYVYYLSDKDGAMHYAKTFDEHKANKSRYLK
jgi:UPF0755 protein